MCFAIIRHMFSRRDTFEDLPYQFAIDWNQLKYEYLSRSSYRLACDFTWWHVGMREKRNAILQRIRQVKQNSDVYQYNLLQDQTSTTDKLRSPNRTNLDMAPEYETDAYTEGDRRRELQELNVEFYRIQHKLYLRWFETPDNAATSLYKLQFKHTDEEGRSDMWYKERVSCSVGGGCCGRACGCCEKPLYEYYADTGQNNVANGETGGTEGKQLVRLYGHCTAECACCVITHGVYEPHQRLPKPKFVR